MKIRELLEAIAPKKSNLPSAASIDDAPVDDVEDSEVDDSGNVDAFIQSAGSLGSDLYSLTIYNYSDDWANVDPGTPAKSVIEAAAGEKNREIVDAYLGQDVAGIANDRMISNIILNSRNGAMFAFSCGINAKPQFNPSVKSLVEPDQIPVLKKIQSAGKRYYEAVTEFDSEQGFKPGYDTSSDVESTTEDLLDELNNPVFVKAKKRSVDDARKEMDTEAKARNKKLMALLNDPNANPKAKKAAEFALKKMGLI